MIEHPWIIGLIVPLSILIAFITNRRVFRTHKGERIFTIISRTIIVLLLLIALANPYELVEKQVKGAPEKKVIVDNSSSMRIFDIDYDNATITDSVVKTLKSTRASNIKLITDGNEEGMREAILEAISKNKSIKMERLEPVKDEIGVKIKGPSKVLEGVENEYTIENVNEGEGNIKVELDGEIIKEEKTDEMTIKKTFPEGTHKLKATISGEDTIEKNNVFYKTIRVIEKPNLLYMGESSYFTDYLEKICDLDIGETVRDHDAVIVDEGEPDLEEYVFNGNGVMFLGKTDSDLSPVRYSEAEKANKDVNVVVLLDKSGSAMFEEEKEIAVDIVKDINDEHKVGVIAFDSRAELVTPLGRKSDDIYDTIRNIRQGGSTNMKEAVERAINILKDEEGSRNIIIISDGQDKNILEYTDDIRDAAKDGIITHTVNIGKESNVQNMRYLAGEGKGEFFSPENSEEVEIVFSRKKDEFPLIAPPINHFITKDLKLDSHLMGFIKNTPKDTGTILVKTAYNDPVLTVSRYGLGRIAALSTETRWASSMIEDDPVLISRMINWIVGEREQEIEVEDGNIDEVLTFYSDKDLEGMNRIDEDLYKKEINPDSTGFHEFHGTSYAVNYPDELSRFGMNEDILSLSTKLEESFSYYKEYEQKTERRKFIYAAAIIFLLETMIRRYRKLYKAR